MSERATVTVKEVVVDTINVLRSISVPADLLDAMGPPLSRALSNLKFLANGLEEREKESKSEEAEPEVVIEEAGPAGEPPEDPIILLAEGGIIDAEKDQLEGTVQE